MRVMWIIERDTTTITKYVEQSTWLNWSTILEVKIRRNEKPQAIHLWRVIIEIYVYRDMCVQTKLNRPKTALH